MGLRDKLTDLREQAQQAVAEHKDEIQGAVQTAGAAVDQRTHGKYTDKIFKYGQKANSAVEKFGNQASDEPSRGDDAAAPTAGAPPATKSEEGAADA
ncbi:MAG TPA: antitoxin [Solirubrobacteraceae bacterium]|nr:antitoxin [Solirubrobacteraceae bacterium]